MTCLVPLPDVEAFTGVLTGVDGALRVDGVVGLTGAGKAAGGGVLVLAFSLFVLAFDPWPDFVFPDEVAVFVSAPLDFFLFLVAARVGLLYVVVSWDSTSSGVGVACFLRARLTPPLGWSSVVSVSVSATLRFMAGGSSTAGSPTVGSPTAGSPTAGSPTAGSSTAGSSTAGSSTGSQWMCAL